MTITSSSIAPSIIFLKKELKPRTMHKEPLTPEHPMQQQGFQTQQMPQQTQQTHQAQQTQPRHQTPHQTHRQHTHPVTHMQGEQHVQKATQQQHPQHVSIIACPACSTKHYDYARYCMNCGTKIKRH